MKTSLWEAILRGGRTHIEDLKRETKMSKRAILNTLNDYEDEGLIALEEVEPDDDSTED